jgi:hypothetical protein
MQADTTSIIIRGTATRNYLLKCADHTGRAVWADAGQAAGATAEYVEISGTSSDNTMYATTKLYGTKVTVGDATTYTLGLQAPAPSWSAGAVAGSTFTYTLDLTPVTSTAPLNRYVGVANMTYVTGGAGAVAYSATLEMTAASTVTIRFYALGAAASTRAAISTVFTVWSG